MHIHSIGCRDLAVVITAAEKLRVFTIVLRRDAFGRARAIWILEATAKELCVEARFGTRGALEGATARGIIRAVRPKVFNVVLHEA